MSQPRYGYDKGRGQEDSPINCIEFKYVQLKNATENFDEKCKLGEGGFGPVYKGILLYTTVAIKRLRKVSAG